MHEQELLYAYTTGYQDALQRVKDRWSSVAEGDLDFEDFDAWLTIVS